MTPTPGDARGTGLAAIVAAIVGAVAPAWRLFVSAEAVPVLQWRSGSSADALGPWRASKDMTRRAPRRPWHLFANADENARLLACSLVDRLADEAVRLDGAVVERGVTLALVRRLVVREVVDAGAGPVFQLRVVLADGGGADDDGVLLLAPVDDARAAFGDG